MPKNKNPKMVNLKELLGNFSFGKIYNKRNQKRQKRETWTLFFKKGCPYCDEAKTILRTRCENGPCTLRLKNGTSYDKMDSVMAGTNQPNFKTWPKIFLGKKFIGGCADLKNFLKQ